MKSFSQRKGLKPVKSVMQANSMDDDLRNGLWNALVTHYWNRIEPHEHNIFLHYSDRNVEILCERIWLYYFKKPIDDTLSRNWGYVYDIIKSNFFNCKWDEVYNFIEVVANHYPEKTENSKFMDCCNSILQNELSAYRFVEGQITQMTSEQEIAEVDEALKEAPDPVKTHLETALKLSADRKSPDFRNSIKESISAVEAICKIITSNPKADLGQCLKTIKIKGSVDLHPALEKAFECLYGYTSDAEGIRHALLEESNLDFEDAKFMLVSCSAFINYLKSKSAKAGIKL